jgi:hypothetical protein
MPMMVQVVGYPSPRAPRNLWNEPDFADEYRVHKIRIGSEVEDSLFRFKFPPGTLVADRVHNRFYRVGDAGEELDTLVGEGKRELSTSRSPIRVGLVALSAAVALGFVLLLGYRFLRRRRSAG